MRIIIALIGVASLCAAAGIALASRNSSGTYSTPNTFVTGTSISSTAMNSNFSDIATEMTDSLDRSGKGGMLAALRGVDGTVSAPAFSYTSETGSGSYRIGAGDLGWAVSGVKKLELKAAGLGVNGAAADFPIHVASGLSGATANAASSAVVEGSASHFLSLLAPNGFHEGIIFGDAAAPGRGFIQYNNSTDTTPDTMSFGTGGSTRVTISNSGLTIGSSGTAISASPAGSTSWTPGSVTAGTSAGISITTTGSVSGAPCSYGIPGQPAGLVPWCVVGANSCSVFLNNVTGGSLTPTSGTYSCRVVNP